MNRLKVQPSVPHMPASVDADVTVGQTKVEALQASQNLAGQTPISEPPFAFNKITQHLHAAFNPSQLGTMVGRLPTTVLAAVTGASLLLSGCSTTVPQDGPNQGRFPTATSDTVGHAQRVLPGGVRVQLASRRATPAQKMAHYQAIVQAAGGRIRAGEPYVLAIRGLNFDTGQIHTTGASPRMQDTIVVLSHDRQGQPVVHEFLGSTHPGQRSISGGKGVDANRDGIRDVGMIAEGSYRTNPNGLYHGASSYHFVTMGGNGRIPGVRDTNQDGQHSAAEWAASRSRGDTLSEILFHAGSGDYVSSIGCLNVADYDQFVAALGGGGARFGVTLVNAAGAEAR